MEARNCITADQNTQPEKEARRGFLAADVKTGKVKTVQGKELDIVVKDGAVTVDGAKVVKTDIVGSNGVIHVIDSVVLPKE